MPRSCRLEVGASWLGEPLPPGSVQLIQELRTWAVTMDAEARLTSLSVQIA